MKNKIAIIGLTGQSGAGKSTASEIFRSLNIPVIDCDGISRKVSEFPEFLEDVEAAFPGYTDENGLKRREFGNLVFNDREKLRRYGEIIFPLIKKEIFKEIDTLEKSGEKLVILDAPTLFESGMSGVCEYIVSVIAPLDLKIKRILERDGIPVEFAQSRLSSQYSEKFFYDRSDAVLVNDGGVEEFTEKVTNLAKTLRERFDV